MWLFLNPPLLFCVEKAMVSHTLRGSGNSLAGWNTCQVHHICHPSAPWCMCTFFFGETRTRSIQLVFITLRLCTVVCNWDHTQSWRSEKITLLASHLFSKMGWIIFGLPTLKGHNFAAPWPMMMNIGSYWKPYTRTPQAMDVWLKSDYSKSGSSKNIKKW